MIRWRRVEGTVDVALTDLPILTRPSHPGRSPKWTRFDRVLNPTHTPNSRRRQIKSRQTEVLESFNRMKALANELSLINNLPPEVLSLIPSYWPADSLGDLIRATHVCRYWRTALIASPSLWNVIKSGNEPRMRAFILRSQSYPLSMEIKDPIEENVLSDAVLFRLKSLTLDLPTTNLARPLEGLISSTPMLEELSITDSSYSRGDPPVLKTKDFLMLSKLHLDRVSANFAHLSVPHLTVLHLENSENNPCLPDLLQLLEHTPRLEQLVLVDAGPEEGIEPPERVVPLRSLRSLTLHGPVANSKLLQYLSVPASADINLMNFFDYVPDGFMEEFLPTCLDNLPVTLNFTSLSITSESRCSCAIEFSGNEGKLGIALFEDSGAGPFRRARSGPPLAGRCLQRFTPLALDTVTHLTLQHNYSGSHPFPVASALCELLHQLPSLQSIDLIRCDPDAVSALNSHGVNLPSFRSLNVHVAPGAEPNLNLLSRVAKSISLQQYPLERVKLVFALATQATLKKSEMGRLERHVQVVEVVDADGNSIISAPQL